MSRLQFIHFDGKERNVNRQDAINYIERLTNSMLAPDKRFEESLIGEPIAVTYLDEGGETRVMFAIGKEGEKGEGKFVGYHIIDSAKLEEDIANTILFLASEQARMITGQVIKVSGGHAL